jgi:hypothetical protein
MATTIAMHGKKWCGAYHLAAFAKLSLKSGEAAAVAAVRAAVCTELLGILVNIISVLYVQRSKASIN